MKVKYVSHTVVSFLAPHWSVYTHFEDHLFEWHFSVHFIHTAVEPSESFIYLIFQLIPANLKSVQSANFFAWSFQMLVRLSEPSAYRLLLDALLITPVTKPPLQASRPSRKSTSALELPKSKRYCPDVACG